MPATARPFPPADAIDGISRPASPQSSSRATQGSLSDPKPSSGAMQATLSDAIDGICRPSGPQSAPRTVPVPCSAAIDGITHPARQQPPRGVDRRPRRDATHASHAIDATRDATPPSTRPRGPLGPRALTALTALTALLTLAAPATAAPPRPVAALQDIELVADAVLVADAPAAITVTARAAADWTRRAPLPGARVRAALHPQSGDPIPLATATTDRAGHATLRFRAPAAAPGPATLRVTVESRHGEDTLDRPIQLVAAAHVHLRTDRAVYRPGETLNWRVVLPGLIDARPRSAPIDLAIRDPRGTVLWRGRVETDATGMAAGRLPLGEDAPLGTWSLTASAPGGDAKRTIDLRPAKRPAFFVELAPTPQGARVVARHPSGEPVHGRVELRAGDAIVRGALDAGGALEATLPPGAIEATVTDGADRRETARLDRPAPGQGAELAIITPDAAVAGRPIVLHVVAADATGLLAAAPILRLDDAPAATEAAPDAAAPEAAALTPDAAAPGVARYVWTPPAPGTYTFSAHVALGEHAAGAGATITVDDPDDAPTLTLADPVVEPGDPIRFTGRARAGDSLTVTLLRRDSPIATLALRPRADGRFDGALTPPPAAFGLATLRVTRAAFDPATGALATGRAGHTVWLRPAPLAVTLTAETRHRPGATAPLGVTVRDRRGRPVAGAGLAAEVVDLRALALGDTGPDLAVALRHLDVDGAAVAGAAFAALVDAPGPAAALAAAAVLAALPRELPEPTVHDDAVARWAAEAERLDSLDVALTEALVTWPGAITRRRGAAWDWAMTLDAALAHLGWDPARRRDPWGRPTRWPDLPRFRAAPALATTARIVTDERLHLIAEALADDPALRTGDAKPLAALPAHLRVDAWGHRVTARARSHADRLAVDLIAPGPDGRAGTADDQILPDIFSPDGLPGRLLAGLGASGTGWAGGGRSSHVAYGRGADARIAAAPVRSRFDETALWRVGVRTDARGAATLPVELPDSLTGWRIRVEALAADGAVGAAEGRFETWLPLSADVELPEGLTTGDRYTAPLVLHNRTAADRTLTITARVDGAARATPPPATVLVPAGEVRAVPLALEAITPGEARVRLDLTEAGAPVDAVERTFPVEAPGRLERRVVSATLDARAPRLNFTLPPGAAPGTLSGALRIYRGPADAVLDGLESLIAAPYGCFEQTSSTTYPNLMVLRLLDPSDPSHAATRARAADFVATGYQRLVGYEVPGGGFSWFGEAPANRVLTAYGLMEFADMAAVYPVDPALIARTRDWLIAAQREDGGWDPDENWLHDWSAAQGAVSTTAWIAHALAAAGGADEALSKARGYLRANAAELSADPFLTALWALAEDPDGAHAPVTALRRHLMPAAPGARLYAGKSLFAAAGQAADVQATALAARVFHRNGIDAAPLREWLWTARSPGGGWGSTQGTVLALHAALDAKPPKTLPPLAVALDGQPHATLDLDGAALPTLPLPPLAPGEHAFTVDATVPLLTDLRWQWRGEGIPTAEVNGIEVTLTPDREAITRGGAVEMTLTLQNPGAEAIAMPTAEVPVPPGFTPDRESLARLQAEGRIARYEVLGSQINLYLTRLAPGEVITLPYRLDADAECDVIQRGPQAFAYYAPDVRGAAAPLRLRVTAPPELAGR